MTRKRAARAAPAQTGNRRGAEAASRVKALLRVARQLFLRKGYAGTSLNEVIALAGGSKATLRKYFRNKAGLFSAVIAEVSRDFVACVHLRDIQGEPDQVLQSFGERVLNFYLAEDSLVCYRGVVAEGQGNPPMARSFHRQGHGLIQAALAERLEQWNRQGLIVSANALDDADLFLHLIRAGPYERRLIGLTGAPGRQQVSARIGRAVQLFLHGLENPQRPRSN